MKRPVSPSQSGPDKRPCCRPRTVEDPDPCPDAEFGHLDENILFEVLKHVDARTLARCSCVNKTWNRTSRDERLWEIIFTRHCPNIGCGNRQLRSVVLALGGFWGLHYLSKQQQGQRSGWGKDEVHLFLSLMSIRCYEKMNFSSRGR